MYRSSISVLLLIFLNACQTDSFENRLEVDSLDCNEVTYSANVSLLIETNCSFSGCHASGDQFPDLSDVNGVQIHSAEIRRRVLSRNMPIGRTMTNNEINIIVCWIDNGAADN